jgi:hypothetical protein
MNQWAPRLMPDTTRHLRRVSLQLPVAALHSHYENDLLYISLNRVDGDAVLKVEENVLLKPDSQKLLSDRVAATAKLRRA